ncbi:hypothetical protein DESAMIL20_534 [Desulfurella amilsii]|uniref:Uncharacterized protein n=1 Tax=Desulfurella amilsii TaxID=1562698 RepID=A0A1X4XYP0_9BACT|nr:hypothetical protein DESAMIL20_534 [Desulfurella amilsii]
MPKKAIKPYIVSDIAEPSAIINAAFVKLANERLAISICVAPTGIAVKYPII